MWPVLLDEDYYFVLYYIQYLYTDGGNGANRGMQKDL